MKILSWSLRLGCVKVWTIGIAMRRGMALKLQVFYWRNYGNFHWIRSRDWAYKYSEKSEISWLILLITMDARARTNLRSRLNEATNSLFQGSSNESRDSSMISPDFQTSTPVSYDRRRPFIPRSNALLSSITECDRNELNKWRIEKQLAACLSALINGPDVFVGEEKTDIL